MFEFFEWLKCKGMKFEMEVVDGEVDGFYNVDGFVDMGKNLFGLI